MVKPVAIVVTGFLFYKNIFIHKQYTNETKRFIKKR
jgi:hypothetical protein